MTIYESINVINAKNKSLKEIIAKYVENIVEYNTVFIEIKQFKKQFHFDSRIKQIRNKTAGHFDLNFKVFYETAFNINPEEFIASSLAFIQVISSLYKLMDNINYSSNLHYNRKKIYFAKEIERLNTELNKMTQAIVSKNN